MKFYTIKEVAKMLRTTRQLIADEIKKGRLKAYKIRSNQYRISEQQIDEYLKRCEK
jgi:excisionase family DNA binding protein